MIKVLIADDEQRFRLYMQKVLDWEALGFTIWGIASNGEQAMEMLEEGKPDIALLDINMPRMDGLSLTERLREISPNTRVIFITGYSEFEYARRALKLGVHDYLLKPFSKDELVKVLLPMKEAIKKERESRKAYLQERKIIRDELLRKLIRMEAEDSGEYREKLEQLGVDLSASCFRVSIIELDRRKDSLIKKEDVELWKFGIGNILEELGEAEEGQQILFLNHTGDIVSLFSGSRESMEEVPKLMERLLGLVNDLLGLSVTIGVGRTGEGLESVSQSYRNALVCLQDKFVGGGGRVISYEKYCAQGHKADFYRMDLNEQLLICLRKNEKEQVTKILSGAEKEMERNHYSPDYVNAAVMGILSVCLSYIVEMRGDIGEILGNDFSPYQELQRMESMEESFAWLRGIFWKTADYFHRPRSRRADEIITEVEAYVQQHYADFELTVEDIADAVFLDISYIRKIFSKHKNYTLQEYITSVRMKAAKGYLEEGIHSVAEVGEMCGYIDAGYFGRCFKKYYHVTPKQYVNQLQN